MVQRLQQFWITNRGPPDTCWTTSPLYPGWAPAMHPMLLGLLFLAQIIILLQSECSPVPIPGTAEFPMIGPDDHQRRLTDYWTLHAASRKGEGYCASTRTVEAETWTQVFSNEPANGGQRPPMSFGSNTPDQPRTKVHKRSFKRACRRAMLYGSSQYHGRHMRPQDFPAHLSTKCKQNKANQDVKLPGEGHHRPLVDSLSCTGTRVDSPREHL